MNAEHTALDYGGERHVVKHLGAVAPHVGRPKLAYAFIVEAIHLKWPFDVEGSRASVCR